MYPAWPVFLAVAIALSGCTEPSSPRTEPADASLPVNIMAFNDGQVPIWVKTDVFAPGQQKDGGQRMVEPAGVAKWQAVLNPPSTYEVAVYYAQTPNAVAGWELGFRGAFSATSCPDGSTLNVTAIGGWNEKLSGFHAGTHAICEPGGQVLVGA